LVSVELFREQSYYFFIKTMLFSSKNRIFAASCIQLVMKLYSDDELAQILDQPIFHQINLTIK